MLKRLNQKGDTILEVLISVAVLSLILVTSFSLANRSSQATRQAAERGEASKIAQSEIEELKEYLSQSGVTEPTADTFFCINPSQTPALISGLAVTLANIDAPATYNAINNNCREGTDDRYAVMAVKSSANNTYTVHTRWDSVAGRTDKINLVHRVHPQLSTTIATGGASVPILIPSNISITSMISPILRGQNSTITWSVSNATDCRGSWAPTIPQSTTSVTYTTPTLNVSTVYSLTCTNTVSPGSSISPASVVVLSAFDPIGANGDSRTSCTNEASYEPWYGDGNDGCAVSGTIMYARRGIDVNYSIPHGQANGPVKLRIWYQQYSGASTLPPSGYGAFNINYRIGSDAYRNANLSIQSDNSSWASRSIDLDANIVSGATNINIRWMNNSGGDPDLQINRIELFRP